ncbi:MAG: hypothetical protein AUK29_04840 [Nitrospirae bacterium CG2_30_53_67]|nr:MAG: hypothetical protein AUK29_04840 [Nitrospirae bacterium CG2_30_53_67]
MKIEVLGCHGSETPEANAAGFLINDCILLEAGTASSVLSMDRQQKIKSVIISHLHLDHIKSLPFLADNRIGEEGNSLTVYGIQDVIDGLKTHVFNDSLWPDFTRIENGKTPLLVFHPIVQGVTTPIGDLEVLPVAVRHSIPSVGLLIRQKGRSLLYTGDTAPTQEIWDLAAKTPDLAGLIVETSFPDRMQEMAAISGHMTPSVLVNELRKMNRPGVPVYIFHMKPKYEAVIVKEIHERLGERVHILREGEIIRL